MASLALAQTLFPFYGVSRRIMHELKAVGASWARSFLAAGIATYLAVGWDVQAIVNAALCASLPVILRYLNPNDTAFGRR